MADNQGPNKTLDGRGQNVANTGKSMASIHDALRYQGNICISGLTASGKTTHSHLLSGEFGLTYISGSQIQLNFMGVSPVQSREFWITQEAKSYWDRDQFHLIDAELVRLEEVREGCVFDTSTMPWRHRKAALCIWLESSLESRVTKAIVSHHGNGNIDPALYPALISEKDQATISLYKSLYDIDIGVDMSPFDLILDISTIINEPTLHSALKSINKAHSIIRAASAFYLTGEDGFRDEYLATAEAAEDIILLDRVVHAESKLRGTD